MNDKLGQRIVVGSRVAFPAPYGKGILIGTVFRITNNRVPRWYDPHSIYTSHNVWIDVDNSAWRTVGEQRKVSDSRYLVVLAGLDIYK